MGWTTIEAGVDWQAVLFLNEFISAINERETTIDSSPELISVVSAGDDIQDVTFWSTLQQWCLDHRDQFLDCYLGGVSKVVNHDGESEIPTWTEAAYLKAIYDSTSDGFRRSTNGVDFSAGVMQAGDIIGNWIFEDLQKALNLLIWRVLLGPYGDDVRWATKGENNHVYNLERVDDIEDWDILRALLYDNWPGEPIDDSGWGNLVLVAGYQIYSPTTTQGWMGRTAKYGEVILIGSEGTPRIDFYVLPVKGVMNEYHAHGTGWTESILKLIETIAVGSEGSNYTTNLVGTVGWEAPYFKEAVPEEEPWRWGIVTPYPIVILRYDTANGYTYY